MYNYESRKARLLWLTAGLFFPYALCFIVAINGKNYLSSFLFSLAGHVLLAHRLPYWKSRSVILQNNNSTFLLYALLFLLASISIKEMDLNGFPFNTKN